MASVRQALYLAIFFLFLPLFVASGSGEVKTFVVPTQKSSNHSLPLVFEQNIGQMPQGISFLGRTRDYTVAIGRKEVRFALPGKHGISLAGLSFEGSNANAPRGIAEAAFRTNSYLGSDVSKYRTGIRNYSRIGLSHLYPGIDVEFYASGEEIEHDFNIAPGANAGLISLRLSGTKSARSNAQGDIVMPAEAGELRFKKPVAYQIDTAGKRVEVAAAFVLDGKRSDSQRLRFRLGAYDHSRKLVIDPVIVYATFAGGSAGSAATAITANAAGDVYLTGYTTSTAASFAGTGITPSSYGSDPATAVFVAELPNAQNGSQVGWLTYLGSTAGVSQSNAIAMKSGAANLFVAGSTSATDFPGTGSSTTGFQATVTAPGSWGFITSLNVADGTLGATTYVDSDPAIASNTTAVNALSIDENDNVLAVGSATGSTLPLSIDAIPVDAAVLASPSQKGFILKLDATLSTESFGTYLMGDVLAATSINAVAADATGNIYVAGYTVGDFPQAGSYSSTTMNAHNAADTTGADSFVAQIVPTGTSTPATLGYSDWLSGSNTDQITAIALDPSLNLLIFGQTNSNDLLANTTYTAGGATPVTVPSAGQLGTAAPVSAAFPAKSGGATTSGFIGKLDASGQPLVITYLGGDGDDTVSSGVIDSTGTVYAIGTTSSTAPSLYPAANLLTTGQDNTLSSVQRAFLMQLPSQLSAVNYVANVGGSGGNDVGVAVAVDGSQNAFVAANIGTSSTPYTSYTALQAVAPSSTASSAYVARIANSGVSAEVSLSAATGSPDADPIAYDPSSPSKVTYTWVLTSTATVAPTNLVVQIPALSAFSYDSIAIVDTTTSGTSIPCTVSAAGASCLISSFPQTSGANDTLHIVLKTTVLAAAPTSGSLSVVANVISAASELITSSQTSNFSPPSVLTIAPASTFGATTVFATASGAASPNTQITYAFVISNQAGAGESKSASFSLSALPANFKVATVTAVPSDGGSVTTCDTSTAATGCSAVDLPGGSSFTYTLVGTYPDSALDPSTGVYVAAPSFTASASGFHSTVSSQSISPNTTVQRGVHLALAGSLSAAPTGQSSIFNLGDSLTYSVEITNSGPSGSSGKDTLTVSLPTGFVATTGLFSSGATCASPYTSCTIPSIATGATETYTVTGSFPDDSTNASVTGTAISLDFNASADLNTTYAVDSTSQTPAHYAALPSTAKVQRTAKLSVTTTSTLPATVCGGGSTNCVYMMNPGDTNDEVSYKFVVDNAGPNAATNATITLTLPSAPTNSTGAHPFAVKTGTLTPVIAAAPFGTTVSCTQPVATQIVCTGGNLPVGVTPLTLSFKTIADAGTVPVTSEFVTTATANGGTPGTLAITESANGAPADTQLPVVQVDRAAHLVTIKSVVATGTAHSLPINLEENEASLLPGANDTFTATVQIGNTPLNDAPGVIVTDTLPPYFTVIQAPSAGFNCTVAPGATPLVANYKTQGSPVTMTCAVGTVSAGNAVPSSSGPVSAGTTPLTFSYAGKFQDNGIDPDITGTLPAKVKQLTVPLLAASSVTTLAADPISPSDATSAAQSIPVERLAHLILRKTRNTSVASAPSSFQNLVDPNLDEKTTATAFGINDEIEYDIAVGNAGVNKAIGVQFTETLPPYFTMVKAYLIAGASMLPDTGANSAPGGQQPGAIACYAGNVLGVNPITLPFATGSAGQPIVCSYGTTANPLFLPPGPSTTGNPDNATSIEFVYQGKFQDNAPGLDNIGVGASTFGIVSVPGEASAGTALAVDNGPAADSINAAVPAYSIQRAAHLTIVGTPAQLKLDETPLTPGGSGGTSIIAEAAPSSIGNPTPVYNCLRYKVLVQNIGPNTARQPQLTVAPPPGLKLTASPSGVTTSPGTAAPLPGSCAYGAVTSPTISGAAIAPVTQQAGNTLVIDLDGYFDLNTLAAGNSQTGFPLTYTALGDNGVMDSAKTMAFMPLTGSDVTVVNTPAGSNFFVAPLSTSGTRPATIAFGTVAVPGVTSTAVNTSGPALPSGSSPDPRDNKRVIPLYRTGSNPLFYTLGTTAIPAAGINPTGICVANGGSALADGFAKPERVLLWALSGLPVNSPLNAVPNVVSPYAGDITSSVTPLTGFSYLAPGGPALPYTTYANLPAPQSQPAQVCGQVNGFSPAATPLTVAVLEPVNFAPAISPNTQQASQTPGKGVSEVSFLFPTQIHDYNDSDPCYVASSASGVASRGTCDDNLLLTTWIFGGESLIPSLDHIIGPLSPSAAQTFVNAPYEVQAGATLFLQAADQLAAPVYNVQQDCDPGNAPGSYVPNTTNACPINSSLFAGDPPQQTVFGSANITILTPSVGGGSSGLITLPPAADATVETTPVAPGYTAAMATITAGQSVGFQWKLVDVIPATGGTYNLTCFMVDSATQNTVVAFPAGLSCQIPPSITYPANPTPTNSPANPAIYIATTGVLSAGNVHSTWKTATEGIIAAMLLPLLFFRRLSSRPGLLVVLLLLGGAIGLSGCGSGVGIGKTSAVAADTYFFRASATPVQGGATLTTAPFQVKVVSGN